jgi:hypothetical protein
LSAFPSYFPSNDPAAAATVVSSAPSVHSNQLVSTVLVPIQDAPGIMDQTAIAAFESAAHQFLRETSPNPPGTSIEFTYVEVTGQTLLNVTLETEGGASNAGLRRLDNAVPRYDLVVECEVHAEVLYQDEPEDFDFNNFVATFVETNHDAFLSILESESDFFKAISVQEGRDGGGSQYSEGGIQDFFTLGILVSLAGVVLVAFVVGTLVWRKGSTGSTEYPLSERQPSSPSSYLFGCSIAEDGLQSDSNGTRNEREIRMGNSSSESRLGRFENHRRKAWVSTNRRTP